MVIQLNRFEFQLLDVLYGQSIKPAGNNQTQQIKQANLQRNNPKELFQPMSKLKQVSSLQPESALGNNRLFSTNQVLIQRKKTSTTVYLPGYLRIKFKNFLQLDLTNLTSLINATIIFNIYYGDLFDYDPNFELISDNLKTIEDEEGKTVGYKEQTYRNELIDMFMTEVKLNFSRDSAILLSQKTNDDQNLQIDVKHAPKDQQVKFTVRKTFHVHLDGDLRWSPFQIINSILQITVQPITFKTKQTSYTFKVNLMDHPDNELKLSFGEQKTFGHYGLAVKLSRTSYTNVKIEKASEFEMTLPEREKFLKQKNPEDYKEVIDDMKKVNINYFQYAYFNIPMYKFPSSSLVTVFIPLWLLGLINLGIYFQDQSLSDRIGSIIGLMLAFIAYIPTIQAAIPPSSNIVFMQGLVYMQSFASLMTFIHSMRIKNYEQFKLVWYQTPQYWITLIVTAGSFVLVMILMAMHYCCWVRGKYNQGEDDKLLGKKGVKRLKLKQYSIDEAVVGKTFQAPNKPAKKGKKKMFDRKTWSNLASDLYFNRYYSFKRSQHLSKPKQQKPLRQPQPLQPKPKKQQKKQFQQYFIIKMREKPLYGLENKFYGDEEGHQADSETDVQFDMRER